MTYQSKTSSKVDINTIEQYMASEFITMLDNYQINNDSIQLE